jgi:hypothetical protein
VSRQDAFFDWWEKNREIYCSYDSAIKVAYGTWLAALDWNDVRHLREQLRQDLKSQLDPCADGFCPVSLFQSVDDDTEGSA